MQTDKIWSSITHKIFKFIQLKFIKILSPPHRRYAKHKPSVKAKFGAQNLDFVKIAKSVKLSNLITINKTSNLLHAAL